ncbi:MAG: hypothetical protein IKD68_01170 [Solobacterium sp.]|nr:hypothetical protein [Solobacterium sp.]
MEFQEKLIQLLEKYSPKIMHNAEYYLLEEIPENKLRNAMKKYAKDADKDRILALWDTSLFSDAKEGFLFTGSGIYYPRFLDKPQMIPYTQIQAAAIVNKKKQDWDSGFELTFSDGTKDQWFCSFLNKTPLESFFRQLISAERASRGISGKISLYETIENQKITFE